MMVVAARIGHPLDQPRLQPADLARFTWLLPAASLPSTAWLLRTLQSVGVPAPRIQVEADTVIMLRRIVSQTDLLTFLSRRDLAHGEGTALRELELPGITLQRSIGSLSVRNRYASPAISRVMALLRDCAHVLEADVRRLGAGPA
jgi:DNA-binding transcriptional LysR family regulator